MSFFKTTYSVYRKSTPQHMITKEIDDNKIKNYTKEKTRQIHDTFYQSR